MYLVTFGYSQRIIRVVLCNSPEFWGFINLLEDKIKKKYKVSLDGIPFDRPNDAYRFWMMQEEKFD